MAEFKNYLWVEKYRPTKLEDVSLEDRTAFEQYLKKEEIPHLLFVGTPGSGKSTMARILCDSIIKDESDLLLLNGSKERGIQVVRDTIEPFARLKVSTSKHKIIWIEEADNLTEDNMLSLRALIEEYAKYTRFLFTGNYINKFPDAILSRFKVCKFVSMPKDKVFDICTKILKTENINYSDDDVKKLIDKKYPDVRSTINDLEFFSLSGSFILPNDDDSNSKEQSLVNDIISLYNKINTNYKDPTIRAYLSTLITSLANMNLDYKTVYETLFNSQNVPLICKLTITKYANQHSYSMSKHINLAGMIMESCQDLAKVAGERNNK